MDFNIFTFPFEQIGWGLRQLSLSGTVGNVVAIIIFLLVGAIPCCIFYMLKKHGKFCKMDYALYAISVLLLVVLYYMINPGLLQNTMLGSGTVLLSGTFYSVLVGYLVLRMISENKKTDLHSLQRALQMVLLFI